MCGSYSIAAFCADSPISPAGSILFRWDGFVFYVVSFAVFLGFRAGGAVDGNIALEIKDIPDYFCYAVRDRYFFKAGAVGKCHLSDL